MLKRKINSLERIFFPNVCPVCEKVIGAKEKICKECIGKVKVIKEPKCEKCGKQLDEDEKLFCHDCENGIHVFDKGVCIFEYTEELKKVIYQFKYNNKRCYSDLFGYVGAKRYKKLLKQWNVKKILPVPMYRKKKQKRGYNQAEILAEAISEISGIPYIADAVVRVNETIPQKRLDPSRRRKNMEHAFRMQKVLPAYSHVLIIDDIYTTGATIDSLAKKLKKQGVKVYFFTISIGQGF